MFVNPPPTAVQPVTVFDGSISQRMNSVRTVDDSHAAKEPDGGAVGTNTGTFVRNHRRAAVMTAIGRYSSVTWPPMKRTVPALIVWPVPFTSTMVQ